MKYFVYCLAGGCVIGSCNEDLFGNPLTKKSAQKLADYENERSKKRRQQKLGGCFDYVVHESNT